MATRAVRLLLPAAYLITSSVVFAQTPAPAPPPPGVDETLRARVTEFFQDFVDKKFRQAMNLTAEDTQDAFISSGKADYAAFKIDRTSYSDNFTKAVVRLTVKETWKLKGEGFLQDTVVDVPVEVNWKLENDKWVFYQEPKTSGNLTPMGNSVDIRPNAASGAAPKKFDTPTMDAEGLKILNSRIPSSVTPGEVMLAWDKASSTKVVFHNGAPGSVSVSIVGRPDLPGFDAKLDVLNVNAGQDATIEITYNPPKDRTEAPKDTGITLDVEPFSQGFPIEVHFVQTKQ